MRTSQTTFHATLSYTVDEQHPDWQCLTDEQRYGVNTVDDIYTFDHLYFNAEEPSKMLNYAKRDLKLVAGGGYNDNHIHNVKFSFDNFTQE